MPRKSEVDPRVIAREILDDLVLSGQVVRKPGNIIAKNPKREGVVDITAVIGRDRAARDALTHFAQAVDDKRTDPEMALAMWALARIPKRQFPKFRKELKSLVVDFIAKNESKSSRCALSRITLGATRPRPPKKMEV